MYTKKRICELDLDSVRNYKLAYIEDINQTYSDYDEVTKEYVKTEQYENDKELYGWNNPKLHFKSYPNPEYRPGQWEYWAYFCDVDNIGDVWGDDFDDAPYSCNSGCPYDNIGKKEIEVLMVPFALPPDINYNLEVKLPNQWNILNEPWCTEDINLGAIPWIWARTNKRKGGNLGVSVMAGTDPSSFIEALEHIWSLHSATCEPEFVGTYEDSKGNKAYAVKLGYRIRLHDPKTFDPIELMEIDYHEPWEVLYDVEEDLWEKQEVWKKVESERPEKLLEKIKDGWKFIRTW